MYCVVFSFESTLFVFQTKGRLIRHEKIELGLEGRLIVVTFVSSNNKKTAFPNKKGIQNNA